jgi:hypothetical protein
VSAETEKVEFELEFSSKLDLVQSNKADDEPTTIPPSSVTILAIDFNFVGLALHSNTSSV